MNIVPGGLEGLSIASTNRFRDVRGSFARLFCSDALGDVLGDRRVLQINHSITADVGAVRGMHFQSPPHAEMKLVRCLSGRVFDVAVDMRLSSPTFLQWSAVELSADNDLMYAIPEGFAHGFQVLEANSALLYLHTAAYTPSAESGAHPLDPRLGIAWPLPVSQLSDRDRSRPFLSGESFGVE